MINKGFFITLEGCEGTGKSTQAKKIYDYIKNKNISVLLTREPGGCEEAELIRNILVKGKVNKWDGISECLLHNAARRIHMKKVIIPALNNNQWVICDRFVDSTNAYQGAGQGVSFQILDKISHMVCEEVNPNLTIVFDMDVNKALKRTEKRNKNNRYEKFDINFHTKINNYFKNLKNKDKKYFHVNADDNINNIFKKIIKEINKRKKI
tara:strand:+ start:1830 stop:2456 length:627 start_codon:yes stop_codon:yes gene_type:complete